MSQWKRVPNPSSWRQLSLAAWSRPHDPSVYGWLDLDISRALVYLETLNQNAPAKVTLTHLVGKAVASALASQPDVNAIVRRGEIYLRSSVDVFFQVAYESGGNLSGTTIRAADSKSVIDIARELSDRANAIRTRAKHELASSDARLSRLPSTLRSLVMRSVETLIYDFGVDLTRFGVPRDAFGSAMVTNVGTFGLPHAFAPLVPFSRVPIVVTVGAVRDAPVAEAGEVRVRPVLTLGVTLDHRVLDGFQAGRLAERFVAVLEDPQTHLAAG